MEIKYFDEDEEIYSPDGELIINEEEFNENNSSLLGYWIDAAFDDPYFKNEELKNMWNKFEFDGYDYDEFENNFLKNINKNWICYKQTTYGIACGPCSMTAWYIIKN